MSHERGFEREERQERLSLAYEANDRMITMLALGVPATLDQIIPKRAGNPPARSDAPDYVSAESFGSASVDLAGILTEGERQ